MFLKQEISAPVRKVDSREKSAGEARYIADMPFAGLLHARTVRSTHARARILAVCVPTLPEGYFAFGAQDVPGKNLVSTVANDEPVFADGAVSYIGQPVLLLVGPERKTVWELARQVEIDYADIAPILTFEDAENPALPPLAGENNILVDYRIHKGDCGAAFARAARVVEGTYHTGYQEQFYLEPQGMVAMVEDGVATVYGSMQCPFYVKDGVKQALGLDDAHVRIVQAATGGGFGGKEEYPSMLAAHAAIAAWHTHRPVRLLLERPEDLEVTTKRHPSRVHIATALAVDGSILGMRADVRLDAGAYAGLSSIVLQRSLFNVSGPYRVPSLDAYGAAMATDTVPNGAFRGFGAPQVLFAMEMHMQKVAAALGEDPVAYKRRNLVRQGDTTATNGTYKQSAKWDEMLGKLEEMAHLSAKTPGALPDGRLYGVGISFFLHGCGFTGSGERDIIKASVRLCKHADGTVEILAASTDMGQGVKTTLAKIAAQVLGLPLEKVTLQNPDTSRVPNSGPTVASRTILIVGRLVELAARQLAPRMAEPGEVEVVQHYVHPSDIVWDNSTFTGDAYPTYAWGINAVEVAVDPVTLEAETLGLWGVFDVGRAIDARVMRGQMEGGMLQGLGYGALERMVTQGGRIRQRTAADYAIPTSMDAPNMACALVDNPYENGPFGAKGAGELTLLGAAPAFAAAVEQALGVRIDRLPVTPEYLMEVRHANQHRVHAE